MQPKKQENRGGYREGSGQKPIILRWSDRFKGNLEKAIRKRAKLEGKSVFDVMLDLLYSEKTQDAVRSSIFKTCAEILAEKSTRQTVEKHDYKHRVIILAENQPAEAEDAGSQVH